MKLEAFRKIIRDEVRENFRFEINDDGSIIVKKRTGFKD